MDGNRVAAISARDDAPERLTQAVAAANAKSISARNGFTMTRIPWVVYAVFTFSKSFTPVRCNHCQFFAFKNGSTDRTSSFNPLAPWLPPTTRTVDRSGTKPKAVLASDLRLPASGLN